MKTIEFRRNKKFVYRVSGLIAMVIFDYVTSNPEYERRIANFNGVKFVTYEVTEPQGFNLINLGFEFFILPGDYIKIINN